jgi:hypothetical protein
MSYWAYIGLIGEKITENTVALRGPSDGEGPQSTGPRGDLACPGTLQPRAFGACDYSLNESQSIANTALLPLVERRSVPAAFGVSGSEGLQAQVPARMSSRRISRKSRETWPQAAGARTHPGKDAPPPGVGA